MANPKGREPWLEVGVHCASRSWEPHLIASSTEVYVYRTGDRTIRQCLHCHRRHAREAMRELKAARSAGFATVAEYRLRRDAEAEEARKEALVAEAMQAWRARIRRPT